MELLDHPYALGREAVVELPDAEMGSVPMHNIVPRLSETPGGFARPAPGIGQHTGEILAELERWERP
jgi:crotonobetainyl-CoA:carnitine CoA-transferase CaiB-like acyl-CoA transferase